MSVKKRKKSKSKSIKSDKSTQKKHSFKADRDYNRLEKLNSILIENFVSLQKVMTNVATRFESLSGQISKLLQLFEISAKSFLEKQAKGEGDVQKDAEFLNKLNTLLNQNKTIAKGLALMGEEMREKVYGGVTSSGRASESRQIERRREEQQGRERGLLRRY